MSKFELSLFLSYSTKDKNEAMEFKKRLLEFPLVSVFMAPEDIPHGDKGEDYIKDQIKNCDYFLIYGTENYHSSNYTEQEVGVAWAHDKQIIPLVEHNNIQIHGIAKNFQIKTIPSFEWPDIVDFLFNLYEKLWNTDDVVTYLLKYELNKSHSYSYSANIHHLATHKIEQFTEKQTEYICKAFLENDQVISSFNWRDDLRKYNNGQEGLLNLDSTLYASEIKKHFEKYP